ncbi:alpha/beta hydrolase [Amnibacterium sp. CER49]|uniref:alpha/beta fold hydrolase n=1 Tax=Amnibacterium sp. CER49 TaxID=3039161 RepID=UPI00244B8B84|nr:alpha/beta hydrolase [Amnibacterium sp. CER49]MDH2444572.1 alpha/beta hydrolase [Amnibacterium sp. CER49]
MHLAVTTEGDGPVRVALVHGVVGSSLGWHDLVAAAEAAEPGRCTFLLPDLRGHGASARADRYRMTDFASDLVETLPTGLDCVVGHSLGGRVLADAVAALQPERAVYLDPGFTVGLPTTGPAAALFWHLPGLGPVLNRLYRQTDRRWGADNRARARAGHRRFDSAALLPVLRDAAEHPVVPAPPAVPSTVVLTDDGFRVVPDALLAALTDAGWDVRRLPGVRHDLHLQAPERTYELIRDLL